MEDKKNDFDYYMSFWLSYAYLWNKENPRFQHSLWLTEYLVFTVHTSDSTYCNIFCCSLDVLNFDGIERHIVKHESKRINIVGKLKIQITGATKLWCLLIFNHRNWLMTIIRTNL